MIVAAIPPNMASNSNGSIPRMVVPDAMATGTMRVVVALITASRGAFSGGRFRINLVYEDNGVLDVHSNQSQQSQNGEKVECLAQQQQSQYDTDKDKRKHQQDDDGFAVGLEQEQQGDEHQEKRQRHVGCQCGIGFGLAFLFAEVYFMVYPSGTSISFCTCSHTRLKAAMAFTSRRGSACAIITIWRL